MKFDEEKANENHGTPLEGNFFIDDFYTFHRCVSAITKDDRIVVHTIVVYELTK